jgi:hypothetical protein
MTPAELTLEQDYFLEKLRRHNRLLHGWGLVCGGQVRQKRDENNAPLPSLEVGPTYALDARGNEILIRRTVVYDLEKESVEGAKAHAEAYDDPWCRDVPVDRKREGPWYLVVCFDECEARPVRVSPTGCGCDGEDCEYSRIRESYTLTIVDTLPFGYSDPMESAGPLDQFHFCGCAAACPPCPEESCIVLATLTLHDDGTIDVDCYRHRRYALSFACYYLTCTGEARDEAYDTAYLSEKVENLATSWEMRHEEDTANRAEMEATVNTLEGQVAYLRMELGKLRNQNRALSERLEAVEGDDG